MANHAKGFYSGPNPNKAKFVYKLARLELGRFVRIITGHNNLNFFQAKLGLTISPTCWFCEMGNETLTHLLGDCPVFTEFGTEIFLDKYPTLDMSWSVRDLLCFSYHPRINEAFEGSWEATGPDGEGNGQLEETMNLGWLEEENRDSNNNDHSNAR